jgi:hypothetical protein
MTITEVHGTEASADQLRKDQAAADDLCSQLSTAQCALVYVEQLLNDLTVGGWEGQLDTLEHADAVHELQAARRHLRNLARIAEGYANTLDNIVGGA